MLLVLRLLLLVSTTTTMWVSTSLNGCQAAAAFLYAGPRTFQSLACRRFRSRSSRSAFSTPLFGTPFLGQSSSSRNDARRRSTCRSSSSSSRGSTTHRLYSWHSWSGLHATHPKNDDTDDETDDDDDAIVEFDDFGGQVIGGGGDDDNYESRSRSSTAASSSSSSTILADRIQTMQRQEQRQEAVYARNWKLGNWQVRGFSLEDGTTTSSNDDGSGSSGDGAVIPSVCRIVPAAALSSDNASPQRIDIWVGRTDGSVFGVRLGDAYWTKLTTATDSGENDETASTVTGGPELERKMERIDDEDEEEFASQGDFGSENDTSKPFEIVTQIQAGEAAVSAMIAVEDEDEERSYLFTATIAPGGEIKQWTTDQDYQALSSKTLSSAHASSVIALKAVAQENDAYVLLSADRTSLAVWDVVTGELLGQVVVEVSSDDRDGSSTCNSPVIQCVDTDGVHVYVGTVTGHIKAYAVKDILQSRTSVAGNWRASDCPVTALTCGGPGTLGRGRPGSDTIVLYTGDAEGTVKQWEVFAANDKLQQWPKLATQRMPKKAHLFKGHEGSVTAILAIDAVKFVSAGSDGTVRAWNSATGKELFRMDSFSDPIHSLCLLDGGFVDTATNTMLITDGMDKYVCVHDFSSNDDEADFDLEMPEYLNE